MAKNKTAVTDINVESFVNSFTDTVQRREDSLQLIKLMQQITGFEPKMWGPTIIGFGSYHYKYDSGHEGEAPLVGFSPRKAAISLYVFTGLEEHQHLLEKLGKFKRGKACIYINKLADIDTDQLELLIRETLGFLAAKYTVN